MLVDKTLFSHCAHLHPGVEMDTSKLSLKLKKNWSAICDGLAPHLGKVQFVAIPPVASLNQNKFH